MQFIVIQMESITPILEEPYQHHVHLEGYGEWDLKITTKQVALQWLENYLSLFS